MVQVSPCNVLEQSVKSTELSREGSVQLPGRGVVVAVVDVTVVVIVAVEVVIKVAVVVVVADPV
jgi:hypothetical protein